MTEIEVLLATHHLDAAVGGLTRLCAVSIMCQPLPERLVIGWKLPDPCKSSERKIIDVSLRDFAISSLDCARDPELVEGATNCHE